MSSKLKRLENRKTSQSSKVMQHNKIGKTGECNVDTFTFLIPKVPPKTLQNVIPTGKQLARTPLKPVKALPESPINKKLCLLSTDFNETSCLNMIPKGREIPRTPPVYLNLPFRESGCVANPYSQVPDLGVQPLENLGDGDEIDLNIKETIKEGKITIRKRHLPKVQNLDIVQLNMIEDIMPSDKETISETLTIKTKNNGNKISDVVLKDKNIYAKNSEKPSKGTKIMSSVNCDENFSDVPLKNKTVNSEKTTEPMSKSRGKRATGATITKSMVSSENHDASLFDVSEKDKTVLSEKPTKVKTKSRGKQATGTNGTKSIMSSENHNEIPSDVPLKNNKTVNNEKPTEPMSKSRGKRATGTTRTKSMVSSENHNKSLPDVSEKDKIVISEKPTNVKTNGRGKRSAKGTKSNLSSPSQNENLSDVAPRDRIENGEKLPEVTSKVADKHSTKVKAGKPIISSVNQNENLTDISPKDETINNKSEEHSEETSNGRKMLSRGAKVTKSLSISIRRNPQRRARDGINYLYSP